MESWASILRGVRPGAFQIGLEDVRVFALSDVTGLVTCVEVVEADDSRGRCGICCLSGQRHGQRHGHTRSLWQRSECTPSPHAQPNLPRCLLPIQDGGDQFVRASRRALGDDAPPWLPARAVTLGRGRLSCLLLRSRNPWLRQPQSGAVQVSEDFCQSGGCATPAVSWLEWRVIVFVMHAKRGADFPSSLMPISNHAHHTQSHTARDVNLQLSFMYA